MKLIYIRSTMEPKNYSTIRSILKKEQGEKIAPYIFKINDTQTLEAYLRKERITYEIYQEERKIINVGKRKQHDDALLPNKKQKFKRKITTIFFNSWNEFQFIQNFFKLLTYFQSRSSFSLFDLNLSNLTILLIF